MLTLKKGDKAPAFSAVDHLGNQVRLEDYRGHKLILYFYPKDDTPGCTAEACNLNDNEKTLLEKGFKILGVSADSAARHQKFIDKYKLTFPLIPDTEKEIIKAYGVWGPKKFMGREYEGIHRVTFIIDESGIIENIFTKVKTKEHSEQILEAYN